MAAVTLLGFAVRLWPIGRLGLTHFDEGIYALVSSWVFLPGGFAAIDPVVIAYAPPGYPILGGMAYAVLGRSDVAMIAVSQLAGTLTIPVVAWLGRRTFGPGAGFASAVFCAFSGPHVAFSRMAMTDASALLAWLLALGAGMRFLERPGVIRSIALGLMVGLAQQFKYNGWLTGGIVVASAVLSLFVRPEDRKRGAILRTFGWGGLAAGIAWLVVWPWYRFVEDHGGYSALLRHQRSYLGGFGDWWPQFQIQADQALALSDFRLVGVSLVLALFTNGIHRPPVWVAATKGRSRFMVGLATIAAGFAPGLFVLAPYWLGLLIAPWVLTWPRASVRMVGVWWLVLSMISPFYHPYARLWLPYHPVNWLFLGWLAVNASSIGFVIRPEAGISKGDLAQHRARLVPRYFTVVALLSIGFVVFLGTLRRHAQPQPDLLAPSESLDQACRQISAVLPGELAGLRVLVRPPVTYYLKGRFAIYPMAGSDQLDGPGDPRYWALVDSAILRSEAGSGSGRELLDRFAKHWEVVEEFPTTLSLPTALDLDPRIARQSSADRSSPLWLLRPRRPGASR